MKTCHECGQPMKPRGVKKRPNEYDHASGCPYARTPKLTHPMQRIFIDADGVQRFRENQIVSFLLNTSSTNMNTLALMPFSKADREQFVQLIGYSVAGFGELPYVSAGAYNAAKIAAARARKGKRPA